MARFSIIKGMLAGVFGIVALGVANEGTDRLLHGEQYRTLINDAAVKAGKTCGLGKEARQNNIYEAVYQNPGLKNPFRYFSWKTYLPFSESAKYFEVMPRGQTVDVLNLANKHNFALYPARFAESWFNLPSGVEAVLYNEEGKQPVLVYSELKEGQMEKLDAQIAKDGGLKFGTYVIYHNPHSDELETNYLESGVSHFKVNDAMTTAQIAANPCYTGGLGLVGDAVSRKAGNVKDSVVDGVSNAGKKTTGWFRQKYNDYKPW